jgi:D-amino-acid dehydrogenase
MTMAKPEAKIIVVGGGVIGVCCAYFLAKRGARVTLVERDEIGKGASFGNAGVVAPGHGPMNRPGRVKQALKWMFDPQAPLYIPLRPDAELASWLWTFRRFCTASHYESGIEFLAPLGHDTLALFEQVVEEEELDCAFRRDGYYEAYRTEAGARGARHEVELIRRHGYHPESLSGDEMREREPALREGTVGGVYLAEAATCDPFRFVNELSQSFHRNGGTIRTGAEVSEVVAEGDRVTGVRLQEGEVVEGDAVVLATGAYSTHLGRKFGIRLPIQGAKGYHRDRLMGEGTPDLRVTCMLGERFVFCTPMEGFVRFAGTLEFSGLNHDIRRPRLEHLTQAAERYLEGMAEGDADSEWCGLRPCSPDGLPMVGPVPGVYGLFLATGHAMLGLTLGPVTGKLISEMVLDGAPSRDLTPLRVDRF